MRDLNRTFPNDKYFHEGALGFESLREALECFAKYIPTIGYVQGMNFIVAALIYHSNAEVAFLLFITLIEEYGLYEVYMERLPGLDKHCRALERHISRRLPALYEHFQLYNITVEMFATEWVIGLFCSVIPLE